MEVLKSRLGLGTGDVPPRLIKDYSECRLDDRGPFNQPHASSWVSFASVGPIPERPPRNGSGEMARVACTLSGLEKPSDELIYARVKCYICRVVGDPQLGINRFGSP
jgi:hypothetical protein